MKRHEKTELTGEFILAPVPLVLVACAHEELRQNLLTIAYCGIGCSDPMIVTVSIRPSRHSHRMIKESGCFTVNIPTSEILAKVDTCGIVSGKNVDKFERTGLTPVPASKVAAPLVAECPVNLECRVKDVIELGVHHMFIGEIVARHADPSCVVDGKIDYGSIGLVAYVDGEYWSLGERLERAGFSL